MTDHKNPSSDPDLAETVEPSAPGRRSKFGAAADGWDAYNDWVERVRAQQGRISRQAVVAKSLYTVSSYRNWADKARDAFDKGK